VRDDLLQELTLYLWGQIAVQSDETWEIFFTRALGFAQRRVATAFMERNGYWQDAREKEIAASLGVTPRAPCCSAPMRGYAPPVRAACSGAGGYFR
jgi:hypothetical protein